MTELRILIVEDDDRWTDVFERSLASLVPQMHRALDHERAHTLLQQIRFDLIILDLGLPGIDPTLSEIGRGFELLKELRLVGGLNDTAAILVVSGQIKNAQVSEAMQRYKVHHFFDKGDFDDGLFLSKASDALLLARIKRAHRKHERRSRLRIVFNESNVLGSELTGPKQRAYYPAKSPPRLTVSEFVRRANNINRLVDDGPVAWRPEARALGEELYRILTLDNHIVTGLDATPNAADLWLQFSGPPVGLGVPFELLHDGADYLALKHVITREVEPFRATIKGVSFYRFIRSFLGGQVPLRILMVAVDDSGEYTIQEEVRVLEDLISQQVQRLGIRPQIQSLSGQNATRARISEALKDGGYHIFHYSGHGYHEPNQPENSGLLTAANGFQSEFLTAADLISLCRGNELRLVYLNCCLGACTAPKITEGDFFGMFDALARADVPIVLGYRWEVGDTSAFVLAKHFYEQLWKTLSPGDALLEARNEISLGSGRRDNETWASPVLMTQSN
jgi:CheY-like chemotaxis protein